MPRDRNRVALIATVIAVALAMCIVLFVVNRKRAKSTADAAPATASVRQRIEILFDAAQKSDLDRYLDCLAEPLRSQVREQIAANPGSLGRSEAKLNGLTFPPGVDDFDNTDTDEASVVVEKIYGETIERVRFRLTRVDGQWKIAEMRPLERLAPETKFGTPVFRVR